MNKVEKHYNLPKDLLDKIDNRSVGRFNNQTKAIEYYIKRGLEYEDYVNDKTNIEMEISKCSKDIKFLKKLIIQLFVNKNFAQNRKAIDDKAFQDFKDNILKDKYVD